MAGANTRPLSPLPLCDLVDILLGLLLDVCTPSMQKPRSPSLSENSEASGTAKANGRAKAAVTNAVANVAPPGVTRPKRQRITPVGKQLHVLD